MFSNVFTETSQIQHLHLLKLMFYIASKPISYNPPEPLLPYSTWRNVNEGSNRADPYVLITLPYISPLISINKYESHIYIYARTRARTSVIMILAIFRWIHYKLSGK